MICWSFSFITYVIIKCYNNIIRKYKYFAIKNSSWLHPWFGGLNILCSWDRWQGVWRHALWYQSGRISDELIFLWKFITMLLEYHFFVLFFTNMEMSILALILAAVVALIIWALWYGPLFGTQWAKLMKMTDADMKSGSGAGSLIWYFITLLVTIFVHFNVLNAFWTNTVALALEWAFYTWLGYFLMKEIWSIIRSKDRERGLLWINGPFRLVVMIVVSLIYVLV